MTMAIYANNWGGLTPDNKKFWDDMYECFVPSRGMANTIGGEILRAASRICYRFYNDGDTVARYYGSSHNLSWACDTYLEDHVYGYKSMKTLSFEAFEAELSKNLNLIAEYLKRNEGLFQVENHTDCIENAPEMWYDDEDDWDDEEYDD